MNKTTNDTMPVTRILILRWLLFSLMISLVVVEGSCPDLTISDLSSITSCLNSLPCRNETLQLCTIGCYAHSLKCFADNECDLSSSECETTLSLNDCSVESAGLSCVSGGVVGACLAEHKERCTAAVSLIHPTTAPSPASGASPSDSTSSTNEDRTSTSVIIVLSILLSLCLISLIVLVGLYIRRTNTQMQLLAGQEANANNNSMSSQQQVTPRALPPSSEENLSLAEHPSSSLKYLQQQQRDQSLNRRSTLPHTSRTGSLSEGVSGGSVGTTYLPDDPTNPHHHQHSHQQTQQPHQQGSIPSAPSSALSPPPPRLEGTQEFESSDEYPTPTSLLGGGRGATAAGSAGGNKSTNLLQSSDSPAGSTSTQAAPHSGRATTRNAIIQQLSNSTSQSSTAAVQLNDSQQQQMMEVRPPPRATTDAWGTAAPPTASPPSQQSQQLVGGQHHNALMESPANIGPSLDRVQSFHLNSSQGSSVVNGLGGSRSLNTSQQSTGGGAGMPPSGAVVLGKKLVSNNSSRSSAVASPITFIAGAGGPPLPCSASPGGESGSSPGISYASPLQAHGGSRLARVSLPRAGGNASTTSMNSGVAGGLDQTAGRNSMISTEGSPNHQGGLHRDSAWKLLQHTMKATKAFNQEKESKVKRVVTQIKSNQWQKGKLLGQGTSGSVFLCILNDGSFIAMKQLDQANSSKDESDALIAELRLMANLRHENVIRYFFATSDLKENTVNLFMEYVHGGSLGSLVRSLGAPLSETVARHYIRQIVHGLAFLHENHVAHRDIKCDNILIESEGNVKLADFGSAKRLQLDVGGGKDGGILGRSALVASTRAGNGGGGASNPRNIRLRNIPKAYFNKLNADKVKATDTIVGTPLWMAPEVVNPEGDEEEGSGQKDGGYTTKADIWSLGIAVAEMLAQGSTPWPSFTSAMEAMIHIGNIEEFPYDSLPVMNATEDCLDFMKACLQVDPSKRPSASDLLNHPFLKSDEDDDDLDGSGESGAGNFFGGLGRSRRGEGGSGASSVGVSMEYRDAIDELHIAQRNARLQTTSYNVGANTGPPSTTVIGGGDAGAISIAVTAAAEGGEDDGGDSGGLTSPHYTGDLLAGLAGVETTVSFNVEE